MIVKIYFLWFPTLDVEADPIEYHTTNGVFNFSNFWYTIAGLSILTTLFFYTSFREEPEVEANS
jgi:hypothetical protein